MFYFPGQNSLQKGGYHYISFIGFFQEAELLESMSILAKLLHWLAVHAREKKRKLKSLQFILR